MSQTGLSVTVQMLQDSHCKCCNGIFTESDETPQTIGPSQSCQQDNYSCKCLIHCYGLVLSTYKTYSIYLSCAQRTILAYHYHSICRNSFYLLFKFSYLCTFWSTPFPSVATAQGTLGITQGVS